MSKSRGSGSSLVSERGAELLSSAGTRVTDASGTRAPFTLGRCSKRVCCVRVALPPRKGQPRTSQQMSHVSSLGCVGQRIECTHVYKHPRETQSRVCTTFIGWVLCSGFYGQLQRLAQRTALALYSTVKAIALSTQLSEESWIARGKLRHLPHDTSALRPLACRLSCCAQGDFGQGKVTTGIGCVVPDAPQRPY